VHQTPRGLYNFPTPVARRTDLTPAARRTAFRTAERIDVHAGQSAQGTTPAAQIQTASRFDVHAGDALGGRSIRPVVVGAC